MKRYAIYAAGVTWPLVKDILDICPAYEESILGGKGQLVALSDSNPDWHGTISCGVEIVAPAQLKSLELDKIIISNIYHAEQIKDYLVNTLKFDEGMLDVTVTEVAQFPRNRWLSDFASIAQLKGLEGSVAEGGVFKGTFAKYINECFPDRKIWLFDTFESFNEDEVKYDKEHGFLEKGYSGVFLKNTSIELVRSVLPHPEKAVFKKGFFPQSALGDTDLEQEKFVFVNLDFDLYQPMIAGLDFFWSKMVSGGVILAHDYFSWHCKGASEAVNTWCADNRQHFIPIGDAVSVAIIKP
ncbi:MAG: TylF/MycF family methyltransferase [Clostridiales bacterium]|jgi:hypothetical protein|nr:TylF/MycF family methyltransferase [Clostridiales bacterium]